VLIGREGYRATVFLDCPISDLPIADHVETFDFSSPFLLSVFSAKHMLSGKHCQVGSCFIGDMRGKVQANDGEETKGSPCCLSRPVGRKGTQAKVDRGAAA